MKEARNRASRQEAPARKDEKLMQHPEVRANLAQMVAVHWEGWVDEKIPALGGKSPRQAVKTADGRESVEALLRSAERRAASDRDMGKRFSGPSRACGGRSTCPGAEREESMRVTGDGDLTEKTKDG